MSNKTFRSPLLPFAVAAALTLSLSAQSLADTVRLKDGTVLRGEVTGFRDQQFTVLIGSGGGARRSRIVLYMEDVESIEFEGGTGGEAGAAMDTAVNRSSSSSGGRGTTATAPEEPARTEAGTASSSSPPSGSSATPSRPTSSSAFRINTRVRADSTTNGWTNSGLVVQRGQRLRITASGRVTLSPNRFATPTGIATVPDRDKLMRNEPTGALIAVIGDDNDDFVLIGQNREFVAQRDGVLFLGINEGNLNDNAGAYDAVIEVDTAASGASR